MSKKSDRQVVAELRRADYGARASHCASLYRREKRYRDFWFAVHLLCPECGAELGFPIRSGPFQKFPSFCTDDCGFTLQRTEYKDYKRRVVLALFYQKPGERLPSGLWAHSIRPRAGYDVPTITSSTPTVA